MKTKRYNQLTAVNLSDQLKRIEQDPPKIPGFKISRLQYLIHLILSHKQDNHPGAYSLLHMPYLLNVVPGADKYLKHMKEAGLIEWVNHCAGRNSRMYRLVNEGPIEYRAITDLQLIRRIEKNKVAIAKRNSKKYPALNQYIHMIKIDFDESIKTIESVYEQNLREDPRKAETRKAFSLAEIDKIQSEEIYIKVNPTNGRLDSNYTRLPGELIQHLTIDGNRLIELDIRNSQPFFSAALFNPMPEISKIIDRYCGRNVTMLLKTLNLSEYEDIKLYSSLVTKGYFYDPFLMGRYRDSSIHFKDREDLKKQLFVIFFGKNNADRYNKAARIFKSTFPNVQRLFDEIKRPEYNRLAILLQRIESYTILERVAPNILKDIPGLPFITRHDSLLPSGIMVPGEAERVKSIMLNTIQEVTGLTPQIRIKTGTNEKIRPFTVFSSKLSEISLFLIPLISILGYSL